MKPVISVFGKDGTVYEATHSPLAGVDAVVFRIKNGKLIYQQRDETFKDSRGEIYRFTTVADHPAA